MTVDPRGFFSRIPPTLIGWTKLVLPVTQSSSAQILFVGIIHVSFVKPERRRQYRIAQGLPEFPPKATVTFGGDLSRELNFWHHGGDKVIYCPDSAVAGLRESLTDLADVAGLGNTIDFGAMLDDLGSRGIGKLMVEGGTTIHARFLAAGLADEIQLAIAPMPVGDSEAPRFVNPAESPGGIHHRMKVSGIAQVGDIVLIRYLPKESSDLA